jgi:hypothetical protein
VPKGTKKIATLAQEARARSDAYASGEGINRALMLKSGETCRGRFLESGEDLWYLYAHYLPKKPGQQYQDLTLCLDQALTDAAVEGYVEGSTRCRGCELEDVSRPTRVVVNFLRYDEPKLVRDAQGKPVKDAHGNYAFDGVEPAIVVCNFATGVGGRISFLEEQYGVGIDNHVCTIHKTGDKNNPFMIDIVENKKPPEPWEIELHGKKTPPPKAIQSLSPQYKSLPLMSYGDMVRAYSGVAASSGFAAPNGASQPESDNVYERAADATAGGRPNLGAFG